MLVRLERWTLCQPNKQMIALWRALPALKPTAALRRSGNLVVLPLGVYLLLRNKPGGRGLTASIASLSSRLLDQAPIAFLSCRPLNAPRCNVPESSLHAPDQTFHYGSPEIRYLVSSFFPFCIVQFQLLMCICIPEPDVPPRATPPKSISRSNTRLPCSKSCRPSIYIHQLVNPFPLSKPPLSCLSGLTTFPCKTVYLMMASQSSGLTLANQIHWAASP